MLPASTIAEITTNLASLNLQSNIAAQILAAVFAPLLRSSENRIDPEPNLAPRRRAGRPRARARARGTRRRRYTRWASRQVTEVSVIRYPIASRAVLLSQGPLVPSSH
jgi:hypothetical protein